MQANLAQRPDHSDFNSVISLLHLTNLQKQQVLTLCGLLHKLASFTDKAEGDIYLLQGALKKKKKTTQKKKQLQHDVNNGYWLRD